MTKRLLLTLLSLFIFVAEACAEEESALAYYAPYNSYYTNQYCDPSIWKRFCSGNISVDAEFLYWNAHEEGLEYAALATFFGTQPPIAPSLEILTTDTGKYKPGFRVGIGYRDSTCCDSWDFRARYTWYYSSSSASTAISGTSATEIAPLFLNPASGPFLVFSNSPSSSSNWRLHFNTIDVEIGHETFFGSCSAFIFRPHLGVRGAWLHQNLNVAYNNVEFSGVTSETGLANITTYNKNNFDGVGLRAGAGLNWFFCRQFSLFGEAAASLLWGQFKITEKSIYNNAFTVTQGTTVIPIAAGTVRNTDTFTYRQIVPSIDLCGGIGWVDNCEFGCFSGFDLALAWEFQVWFHQNQLHQVVDTGSNLRYTRMRGNLSLQGLVVRGGLAF